MDYIVLRNPCDKIIGARGQFTRRWAAPQGYEGHYVFAMGERLRERYSEFEVELDDPKLSCMTAYHSHDLINTMVALKQCSRNASAFTQGVITKRDEFYTRPVILFPWEITRENILMSCPP